MKKFNLLLLLLFIPIIVNAESHLLYDILKEEAESGGLAKEYIGEHHDSFTEEPNKKIYHWYAQTDAEGSQIIDKNNVVFAGFCWKMIRTTDIGGVRLIYNGYYDENYKCSDSRPVKGYSFGNVTSLEISQNYSFGTDFEYNETTKKFKLSGNIVQKNSWDDSLIGKYTCKSDDSNAECQILYLVIDKSKDNDNLANAVSIVTSYYLRNSIGDSSYNYNSNNSLSSSGYMYNDDYKYKKKDTYKTLFFSSLSNDTTIFYSDSYINNNDGTYTIQNPNTLTKSNVRSKYNTLYNMFACLDSSTCEHLMYITKTKDNYIEYHSTENTILFSKDYTYENGKFKLNGDVITKWQYQNVEDINSHNYTCFSKEAECDSLYYIYSASKSVIVGVEITPTEDIEEIYEKSLKENKKDSTIKKLVDSWYEKQLMGYSDYLEDTIFCNDRTVKEKAGWDKNNGNISNDLKYNNYDLLANLKCQNETDQFSVSNPKAKLKYPVAISNLSEVLLLNNQKARSSKSNSWLMSSEFFVTDASDSYTQNYLLFSSGSTNNGTISNVNNVYDINPEISLKKGAAYSSGSGSFNDPFMFDKIATFQINVGIVNETENLKIGIEDLTQVEYDEEVNFTITPIKGYKVNSIKIVDNDNNEITFSKTEKENEYSFHMPASNITIIPSYKRVSNSVIIEENANTKEFIIEVNDAKAVVYEDIVKFTIKPKEGYKLEGIDIIDKKDNKIDYKQTKNENEYEFIMPDTDVTISPIYKFIYKFLEGMNQNYLVSNNKKLKFKSNIEYDSFKENGKIYIDDKLVDRNNYELIKDSTIIVFNEEYTKKLSTGNHTITMELNNDKITTNFNIINNPSTKDSIYFILILLLIAFIILMIIEKRKISIKRYD